MRQFITVIILSVLLTINQANQPFDPNSGTHTHYIKHKFYDLHFFEYNETVLDPIKLTNNPNAIIQQNVTNADDTPEVRINLNWDFKFYGHVHNWISVSPNGFLTTHPVTCWSFCNWWYESESYRRYIAPIMADFNPSQDTNSHVLYYINDTEQSLSVQWHDVQLWQPPSSIQFNYTYDFQVKLKSDGTIYFYYFTIPKCPNRIQVPGYSNLNYTMLVGLEDAAYQHDENGIYYIYPYEPVNISMSHVMNRSVIVFSPRATCIDQTNCGECQALATDPGSDLECGWCPKESMCSDGLGREIYDYISDDYCSNDEMLIDLTTETCVEYVVTERSCSVNKHVLARYPSEMTQMGESRFYSGVIMSVNGDSNTYTVRFDDNSKSTANVQYSWVHPCSTVSYDYSSYELPAHCIPHCKPIPKTEENSTRSILTAVAVILSIVIVICAAAQLFLYRERVRRQRMNEVEAQNIVINQAASRGIELGDEDEDFPTSGNNSNYDHEPEEDMNRVNHPIVSNYNSISSDLARKFDVEMSEQSYPYQAKSNNQEDAVDVQVVELQEIDLESSHMSVDDEGKTSNKGYDMTPLR